MGRVELVVSGVRWGGTELVGGRCAAHVSETDGRRRGEVVVVVVVLELQFEEGGLPEVLVEGVPGSGRHTHQRSRHAA